MFSRKKNDLLIIDIDEEKRAFYRVKLSRKEPIDVSIGRNRYQVKDIGAGGICIYRRIEDKGLEIGKEYPFKLSLTLINEVISGIIRIVDSSDRAYHCVFIGFSEEQREKIHLFVLESQKEELIDKRKT